MQEMTIVLATIARHFRLEVLPGHAIQPVHRVTMRPEGGMMMTLHRRRTSRDGLPVAAE
jgi:cytochrome P450